MKKKIISGYFEDYHYIIGMYFKKSITNLRSNHIL